MATFITAQRETTQAQATQLLAVCRGFMDKTNDERRAFGGFLEELAACDGCLDAPEALPTGGSISGPVGVPHCSNYCSREG